MACRLPLRRGGCCRHVRLFAVRGVCSPERGPRPCRHAFSFNRHACPRGVPLVISYATWRTVLYGVAYPGRHGGSTRHACLGRGGQYRHVAGRGAHGRSVRHAWRTSSFPASPARHVASAFRTRGVPPFPHSRHAAGRGAWVRHAWRTLFLSYATRSLPPAPAYFLIAPPGVVRRALRPLDRVVSPVPGSASISHRRVPLTGRSPPQVSFFRGSFYFRYG